MPTRGVWELEASLECELDGRAISIEARRGVIIVRVENSRTVGVIVKGLRRLGPLQRTLIRITKILIATSQRLDFYVDNVKVISMGHGIDSGLLSVVGIRHVRVWPFRVFRHRRSS